MPSSPLRVGFIGLSTKGWAAAALAPSLIQPEVLRSKYTLTAISTTSKESALESAAKYTEQLGHVVKAYHGDSSKIANDPDVDLVAIAVKTPCHKAAVMPAIEAKKSIFLEWPVGTCLEETIEVAEAVRRQGVRMMIGLQSRQNPVIKRVKELIASGQIGEVRSTSIIALAPQDLILWGPKIFEGYTYASEKKNGTTVLSISVGHQLDIFTYVLGGFSTVSATASTLYPLGTVVDRDGNPTGQVVETTAPDHIAIAGVLESGVFSSITWRCGYASTPGRCQFLWEIDGEKGSIRLESNEPLGAYVNTVDPVLYLNGERIEVQASGGSVGNLTRAWVEFARGDKGDYPTIDDAVRIHKILHAIERSIEERRTIVL